MLLKVFLCTAFCAALVQGQGLTPEEQYVLKQRIRILEQSHELEHELNRSCELSALLLTIFYLLLHAFNRALFDALAEKQAAAERASRSRRGPSVKVRAVTQTPPRSNGTPLLLSHIALSACCFTRIGCSPSPLFITPHAPFLPDTATTHNL
jgi:hypothetical protein